MVEGDLNVDWGDYRLCRRPKRGRVKIRNNRRKPGQEMISRAVTFKHHHTTADVSLSTSRIFPVPIKYACTHTHVQTHTQIAET